MVKDLHFQFHDAKKTENIYPQSDPANAVPAEEFNNILPKTHIT